MVQQQVMVLLQKQDTAAHTDRTEQQAAGLEIGTICLKK